MRGFHVINIGCKVNRIETDTFAAALISAGWESAALEDADLILVNTCTVTSEADKKCRKAVRQALARNESADVLVTGCAVAIDPFEFESLGHRVRALKRSEVNKIISENRRSEMVPRIGDGFNTRVGIKIQDGCAQHCSYCIVRTARPVEESADPEFVLREARSCFEQGVNEIVLSGINIGAYNSEGWGLADLASRLIELASEFSTESLFGPRIRLSSIEPRDVSEKLVELLACSKGRFCRHLHIPLQSGSTQVLEDMNRPYTAEWYHDLVSRLRAAVPHLSLSTDIIVGFPGEIEAQFCETLDLARACGFSKIHVFPYSARKGTPAAARTDHVDPQVKSERARRLRELGRELRAADLAARFSTHELVLVEPDHALTESYHEVAIPEGAKIGDLVEIQLSPSCMLQ